MKHILTKTSLGMAVFLVLFSCGRKQATIDVGNTGVNCDTYKSGDGDVFCKKTPTAGNAYIPPKSPVATVDGENKEDKNVEAGASGELDASIPTSADESLRVWLKIGLKTNESGNSTFLVLSRFSKPVQNLQVTYNPATDGEKNIDATPALPSAIDAMVSFQYLGRRCELEGGSSLDMKTFLDTSKLQISPGVEVKYACK